MRKSYLRNRSLFYWAVGILTFIIWTSVSGLLGMDGTQPFGWVCNNCDTHPVVTLK